MVQLQVDELKNSMEAMCFCGDVHSPVIHEVADVPTPINIRPEQVNLMGVIQNDKQLQKIGECIGALQEWSGKRFFLILFDSNVDDGERVVWEVGSARLYRDTQHKSYVYLSRRKQPPPSAKVDLRNDFTTMQSRRSPYDKTKYRVKPPRPMWSPAWWMPRVKQPARFRWTCCMA